MSKNTKKVYSGIGGQAVLEGVMMKNGDKYAVAVRKPDGNVAIEVNAVKGLLANKFINKIPFVRGVINFIDSLVLGMRALNFSASFYEEEDEDETKMGAALNRVSHGNADKIVSFVVTILSFALALGIFVLLPYYATSLLFKNLQNDSVRSIIEGVLRIIIFILYIQLISFMRDIKRLYEYHGAEHKCINCLERGRVLTVKHAAHSKRFHNRCGTSFIFIVLIISIVMFAFIHTDSGVQRVVYRLLLMPVIAGISYEFIRIAGRYENIFTKIISAPGLLIQRITTKEPDDEMIEVAIASVEAVFDWKDWLIKNFNYTVEEIESQLQIDREFSEKQTVSED